MNGRKFFEKAVENWPAKVLSVALALVLFVFHEMSMLEDRFFSVPLKIETNGNLVPSSSYPRMIRVSLRGEANSIYPILEDDIEVYVDLTKYNDPGFYKAPIQIRKKGTAVGVDPLEINVDPLEIAVGLDQKLSKYVPLTPSFRGYLETGYELVSYTMDPSQVEIEGPQGIINGITELPTDYIELNGRHENFTTTVRVLNRDPLMMIRGSGTVEFRGFIQELIMLKNFDNLLIGITGLNDKFLASPEVSVGSVRLEGGQNRLEDYIPWGAIMTLDCANIDEPGTYSIPVQVTVPPLFTVVRYDPQEVIVEIIPSEHEDDHEEDQG
ncbi:CdaR family protein [Breznakiella homolactica]|uniref:CdaR family protein n=1 Tax=Breznakiella homolactica TaxID=2798577 RepID=UPI001CBA5ECD|nr:YbbR-like domain-containing protein [Breznakiella homolactica]